MRVCWIATKLRSFVDLEFDLEREAALMLMRE
jgi:hypothetical protein